MKKIVVRIIGCLCVLASLGLMLLMPFLQINGVKTKNMRSLEKELSEEMENAEATLLSKLEMTDLIKEDLRDNDLPSTKSSIKKEVRNVKELTAMLMSKKYSFMNVLQILAAAPGLVKNTGNLLGTTYCAELLLQESRVVSMENLEEAIDTVSDYTYLCYVAIGVCAVFLLMGLISAVPAPVRWVWVIRWFFVIILLAAVVGICVGVPMLNDILASAALPPEAEDLSVGVTVFPYITVILAYVPLFLEAYLRLSDKKKKNAAPMAV